jgi:hypothetical protein
MDFDYKTYSLSKLEDWVCDAISSGEASPQEIYDTIKNVVQEQYDYYKDGAEKTNELLALLNGHRPIENYEPPQEHREYGLANPTLTQDRNSNFPGENTICDSTNTSSACKTSWNSFWEDNTSKEDKVIRWHLPVEVDTASDDYYVQFPDDLLEAANLKENDLVEWVDNFDGSWTLKKVDNPADENLKD